jgi:hypothetical protein
VRVPSAKMDSRLRGNDAGNAGCSGAQIRAPPPSSPGLTRGSSRPRRLRSWSGRLDGRVKPDHDEGGMAQSRGHHRRTSPFDRLRVRSYGARAGPVLLGASEVKACSGEALQDEVLPPNLMVSLSNYEGPNSNAGRLPPPCGEGSRVGVAKFSGAQSAADRWFSWPRWIPACAGMTLRMRRVSGTQTNTQPPSSPGIDLGCAGWPDLARPWRGRSLGWPSW